MKPTFDKMKAFVPAKDFELSKRFCADVFEASWTSEKLSGAVPAGFSR